MGAALTYARRYALFTLVGIAGDDDLDAPDLDAIPKAGVGQLNGSDGEGSNGLDRAGGGPPGARRRAASAQAARVILPADQSALQRDRLLAELEGLPSADDAANWAHRNLPAKNSLTAADAQLVEAGFQARRAAEVPSERPPRLLALRDAGRLAAAAARHFAFCSLVTV